MISFKEFKDKVIWCVKSQTINSTIDSEDSDNMDFDQDEFREDEVTIKNEEILEPNYLESTSSKQISTISMNIRRLLAAVPKRSNNSHLGTYQFLNEHFLSTIYFRYYSSCWFYNVLILLLGFQKHDVTSGTFEFALSSRK